MREIGKNFRVCDGFLPEESYQCLKDDLPEIDQVHGAVRSHRDLAAQSIRYQQLLYSSAHWLGFDKLVRTWAFWHKMLEMFPEREGLLHDPLEMRFDGDYFEPRNGRRDEVNPPFLYPRLDIGYGLVGYGEVNGGRGVHIDLPQRIVSILLYFNDQAEFEGGEFEVWDGHREMIERIPIRENMAIVSLQDKGAHHRVNPVRACYQGPRVAAYLALSCSSRIWRDR